MKIEAFILRFGVVFGLVSSFTLFKRPSSKLWISLYLSNCLFNYLFDKSLVETKQIEYPVRFKPKIFKINVIYDFLVCPFLSVWYCQSTYHSKWSGIIGKLILFSIPQAIYEVLLERKTDALKFKGKWKWLYSFYLVFLVKIISRSIFAFMKKGELSK
ncbi:hypothetical protein JCM9140_1601 [Halalkalibacter wakoensis JCM 9140]|uniref:Uncharacterized protein n=1 Tax=Halalkalibacter wakoensis JCM 9140 TaxID=1236970 RepID=W4Q1J8_9BACI|nr:CBO0543 family protein [Halalkalibacter wakoensis]GAE25598.1 hypothetical protein JCM9140_1601 [Halalkalibacter wakoensis JCM 9140]